MRTKLFVCIAALFLSVTSSFAQEDSSYMVTTSPLTHKQIMDSCFKHVSLSEVPSGLLFEKALATVLLPKYNGEESDSNEANYFILTGAFGTLQRMHVDTAISNDTNALNHFVDTMQAYVDSGFVPIAILNYAYSTIKESAFEDSLLYLNGIELFDVSGRTENPYESHTCFVASAGVIETDTTKVKFIFPEHLYYTNDAREVDYLQVDFDDGLGFVTVHFGDTVEIQYDTLRDAHLEIKLKFTNASEEKGTFFTRLGNLLDPFSPALKLYDYYATFESNKTYLPDPQDVEDGKGRAHVSIHYSCNNPDGKLRRPFIIVSGYATPYQSIGGPGYRGAKHGRNFVDSNILKYNFTTLDLFKSQEYDVVMVEFFNPSDYIQRNAYVLETIIKWVNEEKAANGSKAQNIVYGNSMGGIVARYALGEMYQEHVANPSTNPSHDTRIYYSHDSPHKGAHVPLGLQALIKTYYEFYFVKNLLKGKEKYNYYWDYQALTSRSGQQMLINSIMEPSSVNTSTAFYTELNSVAPLNNMGCKTVLMCDGSGDGELQSAPEDYIVDLQGGQYLFGVYYQQFGLTSMLFVWAAPETTATNTKVFESGWYNTLNGTIIYPYHAVSYATGRYKFPYDKVPGSGGSVYEMFGSNSLQTFGKYLIPATASKLCFIPSISSAAINTTDYFLAFNSNPNASFAKRFFTNDMPSNPVRRNGEHAQFNTRSVLVLNYEMLYTSPSTIVSGKWFNYGPPISDRIGTTLVEGGATLYINSDNDIGLNTGDIKYEENPPSGSTYRVETSQFSQCSNDPSTVTIEGNLELGDNSNSLSGELVIRPGSKLVLKNGAIVTLHNNSKLIVQSGADIEIESGVTFNLVDDNSEIIIKGSLKMFTNATIELLSGNEGNFNFGCPDGSYCDIELVGNNSIDLNGNGRADKVLKVTGKGLDLTGLVNFDITSGKVELGSNTEIIIDGSMALNAAKFTKAEGVAGTYVHKGITLNSYSGKTVTIDNCRFEYAQTGFAKTSNSTIPSLTIEGTSFANCSTGISTSYGKYNFINASFDDCITGWKAINLSNPNDFRGYMDNVQRGIDYTGSSNAHLFVYESQFNNCTNSGSGLAILADGEFNLTLACTNFENNDNDIQKIDGTLNLSSSEDSGPRFFGSAAPGGYCYFSNTEEISISLDEVDFYAYDGYNIFDYTITPDDIFAGTITSNTSTLQLGANNWYFQSFSPNDDLPSSLFNISSITATPTYTTSTKWGSSTSCASVWDGIQEVTERKAYTPIKERKKIEFDYQIFPNPASSELFLKLSKDNLKNNVSVKAIDMMGRTITLNKFNHDNSLQTYDISHLAVGMYQIIVEQNGKIVYKQKLVVSR